MSVAFQGETGAYSEEAIIQNWGETVLTVPKPYLRDVFDAVESGEAELGLVPVENTIQGSIVRTFDLLNERTLKAQGEVVYRVIHCLIVNPGTKLSDLKLVYSHPQALGQSREFLEKHNLEPVNYYDTAGSVSMIRDKKLLDAGAIASSRAADVYRMEIIKRGIETHKENYTRFLVIGKSEPTETDKDKTSLAFVVKHIPGSLTTALKTLSDRGINLMKIESRPLVGKPFEYIFFIEFEGHRENQIVKEALAELTSVSDYLKILGSYPKA
jgi:prephenate dehydratase